MSEQENRNRWKRDGWEATVRIGVLTPHADVGPESELQAMAPRGVGIHAARVPFGAMAAGGAMDPTIPLAAVRAFAQPPHVDNAAELLAAAPLNAIAYGFTSSAYMIGVEGEARMIARLRGGPLGAVRAAERPGEDHARRSTRLGQRARINRCRRDRDRRERIPRGRGDRRAGGGPWASHGDSKPSAALGCAAGGRCRSELGNRLRPPV
jgi:hypothetical protein